MKTISQIILTIVIAAAVAYGVVVLKIVDILQKIPEHTEASKLPDKIRCGYVVYPPYFIKDPNTGKFSGIFYDLTQKISELTELPVEYTSETTYATYIEDMKMGKFNAFCGGLWPESKQAKNLIYSIPSFYAGLNIYARQDDARFAKDIDIKTLNDPAYSFATQDGEMSQIVQQSDFSHAKTVQLTNMADISQLAETVATGKADLTIIERAVAEDYNRKNPGKLRQVNVAPIRLFENDYAFDPHDLYFSMVMNTAIKELLYRGYVEQILQKYETTPGIFYRVAKSYEEAK